jgi:integrase
MVNNSKQPKQLSGYVLEHIQYLRDLGQKPSTGRVSVLSRIAAEFDKQQKWASALDGAWLSRTLLALLAGKAQNTRRSYIGHVRTFVEWGREYGYWECTGKQVKAGKTIKQRAKPPRYFSGEFLRDMWEAQSEKPGGWYFRALIAFCCMTLVRGSSEVTTLKIQDLDLARRKVGVIRHKIDEGDRDEITLTHHLCAEMAKYLEKYEDVYGQPLRGDMYLFPVFRRNGSTGYDGMVFPYAERYDLWATIKTRIVERLPEHERNDKRYTDTIGSHTLRRSYARYKYETLVPKIGAKAVLVVQGNLGHATPEMTLLYIGKSSLRATRDEVDEEFEFFDDWNKPEELAPVIQLRA